MRIHRLRLTAFGPYAATEDIDFEELNDAGIFLMTGPTGAGKTSLLDAVCFALYGVVPGDRGTKTLRSQHAPPDVGASVELEVTLGERRLVIHRTPEWWRPKKRGHGTTKVQASARLLEVDATGEQRLVSHRIPEVGHELGAALGMSSEQFMQVVLLPQGRFQTFLHATSDERQRVLQRLFATERFARIEDWMQDRARTLRTRSAEGERRIGRLLGAVSNRSGVALPASLADLSGGGYDHVSVEALAWARSLHDLARARAGEARTGDEQARTAVATLEARLAEEERVHGLARRHRSAQQDLAALAGREPELRRARDLLDRHRRAEVVLPVARSVTQLADEARRAGEATRSRVVELTRTGCPTAPDLAGWRLERDAVTAALSRLRSVAPEAAALESDRARLVQERSAQEATAAEVERSAATLAALPSQRAALADELAGARAVAADASAAAERVEAAARRRSALDRLGPARQQAGRLAEAALTAREAAAMAHEAHLALLERRLAGMADELARQLVAGEPCQVCGSTEHPGAAADVPSPGAPVTDADQERSLHRHTVASDAAEAARAAADEAATTVRLLEQATEGREAAAVAVELHEAQTAQAAAEAAARLVPELEARLADLDQRAEQLASRHDTLLQAQRDRERTLTELDRSILNRTAVLAAELGEHATVEDAERETEGRLALLDDLIGLWEVQLSLEDRWAAAAAQGAELALTQGFADIEEAAAALLEDDVRRRVVVVVEEVERLEAAARRVLDDPEVAAVVAELGDEVPTDPATTRLALREARARAERATSQRATTEADASALAALLEELRQAVTDWGPDQRRHETADRLARLVRGTGGDNQLQMRLSSYVLATRLDQVLDAANERLGQMRDHRYELARTDRGRGGGRAGLGLEVFDAWTGESRDAGTLSGGETFVVSLALALGLADVVAQESGGTRVDTLFVDEGFSSLDPDTLDDVMDRIDALRSGGRTVGVVSHVTELRARIPTQLHVEATRTGSTVRARTSVA